MPSVGMGEFNCEIDTGVSSKGNLPPTFRNGGAPVGKDRYKAADSALVQHHRGTTRINRVLMLPVVPEFVNHLVVHSIRDLDYLKVEDIYSTVHEEQWI